ncbi:MAG TPA: hypothetical protein VMR25_09830 [Planctomycetaceae bacterium]|jgi:hypothetical protein|nr:hypothetical protein [Planctomycetaceae bacterium]
MGANHSGEARKRHMKRCMKDWKTRQSQDARHTVITKRGVVLKPHKPA